jgi:hypothetical protein
VENNAFTDHRHDTEPAKVLARVATDNIRHVARTVQPPYLKVAGSGEIHPMTFTYESR